MTNQKGYYLGMIMWTPLTYHTKNKEYPILKRVLPWYRDQSGNIHLFPTELKEYRQ